MEPEDKEPSFEEIKMVMKILKNNKAAGTD